MIKQILWIVLSCHIFFCSCRHENQANENQDNLFFAMDTGTKDDKHDTVLKQVEMLKELGYDGIDHTGCQDLPALLAQTDKNGLKLFALYLNVTIYPDSVTYDKGLKEAITLLKDRDVFLWVPLRNKSVPVSSQEGDEAAIQVVRELADMAAESGLKIALYPHTHFWMERIEDALRVAQKVNRNNVGVTINLCHWLKVDKNKSINSLVEMAMPYLFLVTINGADYEGDWKQLIQPLDSGSFDVYPFYRELKENGYKGPIGLQGYGIGGDVYQNLSQSIGAWQAMKKRYSSERK